MPRRSDIWRIGLVDAKVQAIAAAGTLEGLPVRWLPAGPPFTFLADPFGLWRDGALHVFAEAYDYRTRHGTIDLLHVGAGGEWFGRTTVLREPWHLSYPCVFEADGAVFMAPEAHRSGGFTLYRAAEFPHRWEPFARPELDTPAIDPTPFRHDGLWWLAYSPAGPQAHKQGRLHLAFAESLSGPWRAHPGNPVRIDRASSRPGGAPFLHQGVLTLPVQDCVRTYGAAIRLLRIRELTPDGFAADAAAPIAAPTAAAPYRDGLHTLSACGDLTLVDVKRTDRSLGGLAIDAGRVLGRWRS
ncbi:glucosamine inositolphosphorylceramide transferase family protein [Phenylobacterium sp.]|jgi:hypothetical protein|uniref:glucosamine inositolphosphorylceramide transferase family protein n=1 Tax=Phenylobacterium sp. TaxID=1871053 RepID=UPI002F4097F7